MKFTKDDAFKSLESYLTDNGRKPLLLSKRSVEKQIETLMPLLAGEETELSVFVDQVKATFKTMQDNLRYDNSQFVKKWEDEHPATETNGTNETNGTSVTNGTNEAPANSDNSAIAELRAEIEALKEERENARKAESAANKRNEIAKALGEKGVNDPEWVRDLLSEVTIGEDTDVAACTEKYLKIYNKGRVQTPVSVTPQGANGGGAPSIPASLAEAASRMKAMAGVAKAEVQ